MTSGPPCRSAGARFAVPAVPMSGCRMCRRTGCRKGGRLKTPAPRHRGSVPARAIRRAGWRASGVWMRTAARSSPSPSRRAKAVRQSPTGRAMLPPAPRRPGADGTIRRPMVTAGAWAMRRSIGRLHPGQAPRGRVPLKSSLVMATPGAAKGAVRARWPRPVPTPLPADCRAVTRDWKTKRRRTSRSRGPGS